MPPTPDTAATGRYLTTNTHGETVRAFVPDPLRPDMLGNLKPLLPLLEKATRALGRLDGAAAILPDTPLFLYMYVRKEALLSSQIEGTQSSLSDLLTFENDEAPGAPTEDVREVSNYVAAMDKGLTQLAGGMPLSNRLIRDIHRTLLSGSRGGSKDPGEFRRSQVWLGGTRPGNALFVPPPAPEIPNSMSDLEKFLHTSEAELPVLLKAGLAHVQFETIHPFLDGNGRVGRLLITFVLCADGIIRQPLLYLSLYLKQHRQTYYDLLQEVRLAGRWTEWLEFFLTGVAETADQAAETASRLLDLFAEDAQAIETLGRSAGSVLRLHQVLQSRPLISIPAAEDMSGLSRPTVGNAMAKLEHLGIVRETTGKRRDRLFAYGQYLDILSEGTEPL